MRKGTGEGVRDKMEKEGQTKFKERNGKKRKRKKTALFFFLPLQVQTQLSVRECSRRYRSRSRSRSRRSRSRSRSRHRRRCSRSLQPCSLCLQRNRHWRFPTIKYFFSPYHLVRTSAFRLLVTYLHRTTTIFFSWCAEGAC